MADLVPSIDNSTRRLISVGRARDVSSHPSRLPGWTVGHVLAHVALNAEAFVRVAQLRRRDEIGVMYPDGVDGRGRDIDELALRPIDEIVGRLELSGRRFVDTWADPVPDGPCCTAVGEPEFRASTVPLRRLREVEVHGFDTGLDGLGFEAWSDQYVDADLVNQWPTVARRTTETVQVVDELGGVWTTAPSSDGRQAVRCTRRELLAWILDRDRTAALPELAPWGNQSRWGR